MELVEKYSLEKIIRLCGGSRMDMFEGCIVADEDLPSGYNSPLMRTEEHIVLLCTRGGMRITLDGQEYNISSGSLFVYSPNSAFCMQCIEHCSFICIAFTKEHLGLYYNYWIQIFPLMEQMHNRAKIQLTEEESAEFKRLVNCVRECMNFNQGSEWLRQAVFSSTKMLLCCLFDKVQKSVEYCNEIQKLKGVNRNEEYFSRFMNLLSTYYKQERKVEFYASRLCVTTKYLSSVMKESTGKTPSQWIHEAVIEEIRYLLRNSSLTVKEIAYQLNFPNVSFFGKYFKRECGLSPLQYRVSGVFAINVNLVSM